MDLLTAKDHNQSKGQKIKVAAQKANVHGGHLGEGILQRIIEQRVQVEANATTDARRTDYILQHQIPSNNKGHKLPNAHITVDISGACLGYACSEFRIANACQERCI